MLYKREIRITEDITLRVPLVGEILECEDEYNEIITIFTSMPIDMMVQLDEIGVDFTKINEWELFLLLFSSLKSLNYKMILPELELSRFEFYQDKDGNVLVMDTETGVRIDRAIYNMIGIYLRTINNTKKNLQKPGNEESRRYLIEREKKRLKREARRQKRSQIEDLIISMVNSPEYKYNYESTLNLTIYQFNTSVQQVISRVKYDDLMIGCYAGTVDIKKISQDELNWLTRKENVL